MVVVAVAPLFKPLREIAVPQGNPGERAPESHGVSRSSRQNPALAVPGESCGRKVTAKKVSDNLVRMSVATPLAGGARALAKFLLGLPRLKEAWTNRGQNNRNKYFLSTCSKHCVFDHARTWCFEFLNYLFQNRSKHGIPSL